MDSKNAPSARRVKGHDIDPKIYETHKGKYSEFKVCFYRDGKRFFESFSKRKDAEARKKELRRGIVQGSENWITLAGVSKLDYEVALKLLKPLGLTVRIAVERFVEAVQVLDGVPVLEACKWFAARKGAGIVKKTVSEVFNDLLAQKKADGRSRSYIKDLGHRCGRFADSFHCNIADVTTAEINQFLNSLTKDRNSKVSLSGRSKNNFRLSITTLFQFAKSNGYLPRDNDVSDGIAEAAQGKGDILIFTPADLTLILKHATPDMVPYLAIGAFAGLRSAELERLDWAEVGEDFIKVKAENSKTRSRRLVPVCAALNAWLAPYRGRTGKVCNFVVVSFQLGKLARAIDKAQRKEKMPGWKWQKNGLRHSYISYRVAETQNVQQTALEAGNSPEMIFSNYREVVTPVDAGKWFSITPVI